MSQSIHKIAIRGKDETRGAFRSIRSNAATTGASIRKSLGTALTAAMAFMGARAITKTISDLGKLSDLSMKTGAGVRELTSSVDALNVMGLNVSIDSLAKSFQYLEKNTGKRGFFAMFDEMKRIGEISDAAKRGAEMVKIFGRSGMELMPLVNGGEEAVEAFRKLAELMPGVSDSAANAGDAVADSQTILVRGLSKMWSNFIGYLCRLWADDFPGGVRAGALNAISWIETFFKKAGAWINLFASHILALEAFKFDLLFKGPKAAWDIMVGTMKAANEDFVKTMTAAEDSRREYVSKLKEINVDDLASALEKTQNRQLQQQKSLDVRKSISSRDIRNALIVAGSNEAAKLAAFGPQYQGEVKKQTEILKQIERNTAEVSSNTDDLGGSEVL